jgi:hypothetical protein
MTRLQTFFVRAASTAIAWTVGGRAVLACPICFQMEGGPVVDGVRAAVLVLIAVTTSVLVGFTAFAARLAHRQNPNPGASEPWRPQAP